ncbi:MAG: hypothetical protein ACK47E_18555 [Cyclobacteriaceae bacterium]
MSYESFHGVAEYCFPTKPWLSWQRIGYAPIRGDGRRLERYIKRTQGNTTEYKSGFEELKQRD